MKRIVAILLTLLCYGYAKADTSSISLNIKRSAEVQDRDLQQALEYALSAVDVAQSAGTSTQRSRAYDQAGKVCFYGGLLNRAVDYFSRALDHAKQTGDLVLMGNAYFNLGGVHNILGDYARSRELTERGYALFVSHFRKQGTEIPVDIKLSYYNNIGLLYLREGNPAVAKHFYMDAISLARKYAGREDLTRPLTGLAELYLKTGQTDSARILLTDLVMHEQAYGNMAGLSVAQIMLGELSSSESKPAQALIHFRKAIAISRDRNDNYIQVRASKGLSEVFEALGQADSALAYLEMYNRLSESSEKEKASQTLIQKELESRLKEQERSALRRIRIERTILGILAGGSLGFLFFFIIRHRKRTTLERMEASLREEKLRLEKKILQEALDLKDKQLAAQLMYALQKNEMISELVTRIKEAAAQSTDGQKGSLTRIVREIEAGSAEPWNEFEQRFQEVHAGFYERLMAKHPDLTCNERRLCAFLRLDMSTKEISNLTGQSVKAITQARFRLRSKLGIENPDISLFEVLMQI